MQINERIKKVRKESGLSQSEFAKKLGIKQGIVSAMELGNRAITDRTIKAICSEFHVSERWLRTGEGEPYADSGDTEVVAALAARILRDEPESFRARCIEVFSKMDERQLSVLKDIALQLVADKEKDPLEQEVESYRQEVQLEIEAEEKSAPSAEQNDVSSA